MHDGTSILIAGVGGQGTLLASRIIGRTALKKGYDVKMSEVHGMSQRGGSVVTYVKYSPDTVYSPIIDEGCADYVLAFELLEAYRCVGYLKPGGRLLTNTWKINPMPVIIGAAEYPENILQKITGAGVELTAVDALTLAKEAGSERAVNMVLLGLLAAGLDIPREEWLEVIRETVKPRFIDVNLKAFNLGMDYEGVY